MNDDLDMIFYTDQLPVNENAEYKPIEDGWYKAVIENAEVKPTKAGTGKYIRAVFKIVAPSSEGRLIFVIYNIANPNEEAVKIGLSQLRSLNEALGITELKSVSQLKDKLVTIKVGTKKGVDKNGHERLENTIKKYEPFGDKADVAPSVEGEKERAFNDDIPF